MMPPNIFDLISYNFFCDERVFCCYDKNQFILEFPSKSANFDELYCIYMLSVKCVRSVNCVRSAESTKLLQSFSFNTQNWLFFMGGMITV